MYITFFIFFIIFILSIFIVLDEKLTDEEIYNNKNNNKKNDKDNLYIENNSIKKYNISGNPKIFFNYEEVPVEKKKLPLKERYLTELTRGANIVPEYSNNNFSSQQAIYDAEMHTKKIHTNRTIDMLDKNDKSKTIFQAYEDSITDIKKLLPKKEGKTGDYLIKGATNSTTFAPDYITYKDEKPENGAFYNDLNLFAYDPMINTHNSIF